MKARGLKSSHTGSTVVARRSSLRRAPSNHASPVVEPSRGISLEDSPIELANFLKIVWAGYA